MNKTEIKNFILTGPIAVGKSTTINILKKLMVKNYDWVDELDFNDKIIKKMIEETYEENCCSITNQFHVFHDRLIKFILRKDNHFKNTIFDRGPIDPYIFNKLLNNNDLSDDFYYSVLLENIWRFKNTIHIIFDLKEDINFERFNKRKRQNEALNETSIKIIKNFNKLMIETLKSLDLRYIVFEMENFSKNLIAKKLFKLIQNLKKGEKK